MNAVQSRLAKLEARRGAAGAAPNMLHWPRLLNECERENGGFATEAEYRAACSRIGPGLAWPTHAEMLDIWRRADELLAAELSDWRRACEIDLTLSAADYPQ